MLGENCPDGNCIGHILESGYCSTCGRHYIDAEKVERLQLTQMRVPIDSQARCPNCGSTSLSGQKHGYSAAKGCLGALICLPLFMIGFHGAKKMYAHCLRCGHSWRVS